MGLAEKYADELNATARSFIIIIYNASDVNTIRRAASGASLPNPRIVSAELVPEATKKHRILSMMTALWSQFIYTDLVHLAEVKG